MKCPSVHARLAARLVVTIGLLAAGAAGAAEYAKTVGGYAIYIGILPAQIVQGHPGEHAERKMHGGAPSGGHHQYHVVIALFDAASGARVEDAKVTAKVGELGLTPVEKRLEPMLIAGAMSYGNYFAMPPPGPFRIDVRVARVGAGTPVDATFVHSHPR